MDLGDGTLDKLVLIHHNTSKDVLVYILESYL